MRGVRMIQAGATVVDGELPHDAFVEEMNGESFTGIRHVSMPAMRLAPQFMAEARRNIHGGLTCKSRISLPLSPTGASRRSWHRSFTIRTSPRLCRRCCRRERRCRRSMTPSAVDRTAPSTPTMRASVGGSSTATNPLANCRTTSPRNTTSASSPFRGEMNYWARHRE